ncbi:hypothetical protein [Ancylobacter sp. IITR112]|uniref:hypothetical protein n=1 Tax=Ancylobacter sp. IITR112 TaxID=3138073 RepID=UPI00352A04EB
MDNRISVTALFAALALTLSAGGAAAQYSGNPALRNPGATTPQPKQAGKPPQTWQPAPQPTPAARQLNPFPSCVTSPCNAPTVIQTPRS